MTTDDMQPQPVCDASEQLRQVAAEASRGGPVHFAAHSAIAEIARLQAQLAAQQALVVKLADALRCLADTHAWQVFGERRSPDEHVPAASSAMADGVATAALAKVGR